MKIENRPYLEDMFLKMLPNTVRKYNDWYQNGFLYVRFLNDFIELKTEGADKIIRISNDEQSLYTYLNYLKNFTSVDKINKPQRKETNNITTHCKKCG